MIWLLQNEILDLKFQNELHLTIFSILKLLFIKDCSIKLKAHYLNPFTFLNLRLLFSKYCFIALNAQNLINYYILNFF